VLELKLDKTRRRESTDLTLRFFLFLLLLPLIILLIIVLSLSFYDLGLLALLALLHFRAGQLLPCGKLVYGLAVVL
jgi:hypothetical protein